MVKYLSHSFLCILPNYLKGRQKFVTAGGFDDPDIRDKAFMCYYTNDICLPIEVLSLKSDHEETDSSAWLHALDGSLINILIFSPDTDTYHIGMPLLGINSDKKVIVQLSNVIDRKEYLYLNELIDCMYRDVSIPHLLLASLDIPKIFQNIYIMSGCDYTSFFAGFSKETVVDAFFPI